MTRILYDYWRSSAAFRVRIALNVKGLAADHVSIDLKPNVLAQKSPEYLARNPQGRVPFLTDGDFDLSQSPAILEYLEEVYPDPPLLPQDPRARAEVRALAATIGCDIHPLNNSSVLGYLKKEFNQSIEAGISKWYAHWVHEGFHALEKQITKHAGVYAYGDQVTMADIYLVPQVWNAQRFKVPLDAFPTLLRVVEAAAGLDAFREAAPENQPDAE